MLVTESITDSGLWEYLKKRVVDAETANEAENWAVALRSVAVAIGVRDQHQDAFEEGES